MTSNQSPLASYEIIISPHIVIIMRNSLTPRRNLSLRDSDFFLLDFFRCFFSIMIGSDVPEFNSLIDSPTQPFEEDRLCSPQALMVWASSIWFCHLTLQTMQFHQGPPETVILLEDWMLIRLALTPNPLSLYFKNLALIQKLLTSCLEWDFGRLICQLIQDFVVI